MAEKKFSELPSAASLTGNELAALSQMQSGSLASVKSTLQAIANWFAVYAQYTTALQTTDKSIAGAINELKRLISLIPQFSIEVVQVLPTEDISDTTIYLVPAEDPEVGNYYEEYIHVNDSWELVGTTAVDLSAYYTKLEVDGLLATKASVAEVALKENKADMPTDVRTIIKDCKTPKSATITNGIAQFECIEENLVKGLKVAMSPIQDLHGYSKPWAGGAGKNKFQNPATTDTINGVTFTVNTDGSITISGTASARADFYLYGTSTSYADMGISVGDYLINGGHADARIYFAKSGGDSTYTGSTELKPLSIASGDTFRTFVRVASGTAITTPITVYPMVCSSTETDPTFAPYSNICHISGRTGATVFESGINLWDLSACIRAYISTNGTTVAENKNYLCDKFYFVKKGKSITLSSKNTCTRMSISVFNTSFNFVERNQVSTVKQTSYTATDDCYVKVHFNYDNSDRTVDEWNALCETIELQLQLGDIVLPYEPFKKYTAITHQYSETIYGGSDDFVDGGCTNEWGYIKLSDMPSSRWNKLSTSNTYYMIKSYSMPLAKTVVEGGKYPISDKYIYQYRGTMENNSMRLSDALYIRDDRFTTLADWLSYINNTDAEICYELETPTTISTSAEEITTVAGTNIISGTEPISECQYTELATVDDLRKIIGGQ